jgi:hypothetical protein
MISQPFVDFWLFLCFGVRILGVGIPAFVRSFWVVAMFMAMKPIVGVITPMSAA